MTLPALCLASCLPTGDLSSYSEAYTGLVLPGPVDAAAEPAPVQPSTGGEGTTTPVGLSQGEMPDAGAASPATTDAGTVSPCGDSRSLGPNGNCYLVETAARSWSDARDACRALGPGWDLASIRSARDSAFLAELVTIEAWISASDQQMEGRWVWTNGGDAFWSGTGMGDAIGGAYSNWNSDEPNGGETSDCARLLPRTEQQPNRNAPWADMECNLERGALCEGPLD